MEKSKHLQDQLKELKTEIESLKLEEQQQQAGLYNLRSEARGYVQEPVYIPHSNVSMITSHDLLLGMIILLVLLMIVIMSNSVNIRCMPLSVSLCLPFYNNGLLCGPQPTDCTDCMPTLNPLFALPKA